MTDSDRIRLGHISGAQGIRGEVVIKSFTDDPADIAAYGPLSSEEGTRTYEITVVRVAKKGVIARVAGVTDRNGAEALKGTKLFVDRDKLPEAEPGEYYHADLIGLEAVAEDGKTVGEIVAVQNFGAGDLLEIRLTGRRRTEFVPFNEDFVPELNIAERRVIVRMIADE